MSKGVFGHPICSQAYLKTHGVGWRLVVLANGRIDPTVMLPSINNTNILDVCLLQRSPPQTPDTQQPAAITQRPAASFSCHHSSTNLPQTGPQCCSDPYRLWAHLVLLLAGHSFSSWKWRRTSVVVGVKHLLCPSWPPSPWWWQ